VAGPRGFKKRRGRGYDIIAGIVQKRGKEVTSAIYYLS